MENKHTEWRTLLEGRMPLPVWEKDENLRTGSTHNWASRHICMKEVVIAGELCACSRATRHGKAAAATASHMHSLQVQNKNRQKSQPAKTPVSKRWWRVRVRRRWRGRSLFHCFPGLFSFCEGGWWQVRQVRLQVCLSPR